MKNQASTALFFFFTVFFISCSLNSQAQEGWSIQFNQNQFVAQDVPKGLTDKQTKLATRSYVSVGCMGLAPDGGWVICYKNKVNKETTPYLSWDGTHRDFMAILKPIHEQNVNIKQIVFSPLLTYDKQSWIILYDNNDADWKNLPPTLVQRIIELNNANKTIKSVGLAVNGGWVLIAENNEVYYEYIPQSLITAIESFKAQQKTLQHLSFNLDNGWVLVADKHDALWDNISDALVKSIKTLQEKQATIRGVHFYTIKGKL